MLYWPWNASNAGSWLPGRLRLSSQDPGAGSPLRGAPRLLRRVADLPLVKHLDGVVVERPRVGEEKPHPVSGYHVLRTSITRVEPAASLRSVCIQASGPLVLLDRSYRTPIQHLYDLPAGKSRLSLGIFQ